MKVTVLSSTPDAERVIALAARQCYFKDSITDCDLTEEHKVSLIEKLLKNGHLSVFEHASITFAIKGISRVCSHQLVRHRVASYSQQSQRCVDIDESQFIMPDTIMGDPALYEIFDDVVEHAKRAYKTLVKYGVPKEDARYLTLNAATTNIVVTMNMRELLHFFHERCCNHAQWEIRGLANEMLKLSKEIAPHVFKDAGAPCSTCVNPCK